MDDTKTIPIELRARSSWVCWRREERDGKLTKVLYNPNRPDRKASVSDSRMWGTFEEAVEAYEVGKFEGIGFVFVADDPYTGVDLDDCRGSETGEIAAWAQEVIDGLAGYTEISPSGRGVHIIVRATIPPGARHRKETDGKKVEAYSEGRFFTMTGDAIGDPPRGTIPDRQEELDTFRATYLRDDRTERGFASAGGNGTSPIESPPMSDAEVLRRLSGASNSDRFNRLYEGDTSGHDHDDSRADLALANLIAFYTQDADQIERLMRGSGLAREKWNRHKTYLARDTIGKALHDLTDTFQPSRRRTREKGFAQEKTDAPSSNGISKNGAKPDTPGAATPSYAFNSTDMGNGGRFARDHGHRTRYCETWGGFLVYDGMRWRRDHRREVDALAKETVRGIYGEAENCEDGNERKKRARWALQSESKTRLDAMLFCARSEPGIPTEPDDFDVDARLLNVQNGTIALDTGELKPHDPRDHITRLAPVRYDPDAEAPTWEAFLERVLPSVDLRRFVQRTIGYSLLGDTTEEVLFFFYGTGANGKSTFINIVLEMLGDYAKQAAPELLTVKGQSHPTELANLKGARFVASVEVEEGKRLAESLVKQLTGRDRISARYMRQDFFDFEPTHTILLAANHKPVVKGTDLAIWRRIKMVPFTVTIPEAERDPKLQQKLRDELSGVLAWAVRGTLDYLENGLGEPEEVREATDEYRAEMDVLAAFIDERCIIDRDAKVKATALYKAYQEWCEASGERAESQKAFVARLRERGYERKKNNVYFWYGIGLLHDGPEPDEATDEATVEGERDSTGLRDPTGPFPGMNGTNQNLHETNRQNGPARSRKDFRSRGSDEERVAQGLATECPHDTVPGVCSYCREREPEMYEVEFVSELRS